MRAGICEGEVQCNADGDGLECSERAVPEVCDGLDNDCDGIVDNGIEAPLPLSSAVFALDSLRSVMKPVDGLSQIIHRCQAEEIELTCDGLDNDCDGEIDEGLSAPDADLTLGVCLGATVCDGEASWVEPDCSTIRTIIKSKRCGVIISTTIAMEKPTNSSSRAALSVTDLSGATGLWKGDACGVGAYGGSSFISRTGKACSTVGDVSAETCNGADDDCNGVIDNGFNLSTDEANCGACGVTCTNARSNTMCRWHLHPKLRPSLGDCANQNDGCETQLTSVNNCGACGFVCDLPNAVELCTEIAFVALRHAIRVVRLRWHCKQRHESY